MTLGPAYVKFNGIGDNCQMLMWKLLAHWAPDTINSSICLGKSDISITFYSSLESESQIALSVFFITLFPSLYVRHGSGLENHPFWCLSSLQIRSQISLVPPLFSFFTPLQTVSICLYFMATVTCESMCAARESTVDGEGGEREGGGARLCVYR